MNPADFANDANPAADAADARALAVAAFCRMATWRGDQYTAHCAVVIVALNPGVVLLHPPDATDDRAAATARRLIACCCRLIDRHQMTRR